MFLSTTSLALLFAFPCVFGEVCSGFYNVNEGCDITYGNVLETLSDVATVTRCSIKCSANAICLSVKYDPINNVCHLNSQRYLALDKSCDMTLKYAALTKNSCRKQINEECSSTSECPVTNSWCSSGICKCQQGFSYKYTDNTCVTACDVYGSTYTAYLSHKIDFLNDKVIQNVDSADECMQLCTEESAFLCRTADYDSVRNCYLSVETGVTAPNSLIPYTDIDHYHRNCQSPDDGN